MHIFCIRDAKHLHAWYVARWHTMQNIWISDKYVLHADVLHPSRRTFASSVPSFKIECRVWWKTQLTELFLISLISHVILLLMWLVEEDFSDVVVDWTDLWFCYHLIAQATTQQPEKDLIEQAANMIASRQHGAGNKTSFRRRPSRKAIPEIDKRLANVSILILCSWLKVSSFNFLL